MATRTENFCDRCGARMKYVGWTALLFKPTKFRLLNLLNGNPDGYSYSEDHIELCSDCTKELELFLEGERI